MFVFFAQRMINSTIEKYQLVSAKDRHLPAAVSEIRNYLSVNSTLETVEEKKISDRLKKSLEWRRYYAKKRSHATSNGLPVRHVIKKKKSGSDKENRQPSPTDEEPLLQGDLGSDLHDVGVDNRGFDPDTDSDSDVPLSTLATRKKKSL
ncbi:uncharacterized protein LOC134273243 [Saccostrea cucullata]|uniref:uncharacterized protein LOC134273243 n=1 Tax=Saccostrea cuccullata TaxID=36930 RepID=UPI002ED63295